MQSVEHAVMLASKKRFCYHVTDLNPLTRKLTKTAWP